MDSTDVYGDPGGPTRCVVLSGTGDTLAVEFAAVTGLSILDASLLVDDHLIRGTE